METITYIFDNGKKCELPPPTVEAYYKIYHYVSYSEVVEGICEWLGSNKETRAYIKFADISKAQSVLGNWLREMRQREEYKAPFAKSNIPSESHYSTVYHELKLVSDYTRDSFTKLKKMDILTFWRLYRDAIIYNCNKSDEGRAYLDRAFASVQTKPDRAAIAQIIAMQRE